MDRSKEQSDLIKRALVKIKQLKEELAQKEEREPLAIIGMSCRFPGGASSPEDYWKLLVENREGLCPVPIERWDHQLFYDPTRKAANSMYLKESSFLDCSVRQFDAKFFGISPREADDIDPQHRFLLELSWEAFENAGIIPAAIKEKNVGMFVGIISSEYASYDRDHYETTPYYLTGIMTHMASGRLAYYYGTHGPAISLDTSCSSSLVGFHLACRSLQLKESDIALVGAINLMISPYALVSLCQLGALSSDGRCKPFEASAHGYGRSEGGGFLVLKRLSDAIQAQDNILAIVRGSAVNHDGRSKGLTVPNREAQIKVMKQALADANLDPNAVTYIEAHGTGTEVGDPLEIQAIEAVFSQRPSSPLPIGSVKANIGHTEASAGLASLIKIVLCMQNKTIPAQVNFHQLNPHLNLAKIPAYIPMKNEPWNPKQQSRIAAINSFGFSGTNAHVLLEEWTKQQTLKPLPIFFARPPYFLPISAKSAESLQTYLDRYISFLTKLSPEISLDSIQNAICLHRSHFKYRMAAVGNSREELLQQLEDWKHAKPPYKQSAGSYSVYLDETVANEKEIEALYETYPDYRSIFDTFFFKSKAFASHTAFLKLLQSFGFPPPTLLGSKKMIEMILDQEKDSWFSKRVNEKTGHSEDFLINLSAKPLETASLKDLKLILIEAYQRGYPIQWEKVLPLVSLKHISLPTYSFENQTYWFKTNKKSSNDVANVFPLKGWKQDSPLADYQHQFFISPANFDEIKDTHGLLHIGQILEMIYAIAQEKWNIPLEKISCEELSIERALLVGDGLKIYGVLADSSIRLYTFDDKQKEWTAHVKGSLRQQAVSVLQKNIEQVNDYSISRSQFYHSLEERGVHLGPSVKWVEGASMISSYILARLQSFEGSFDFHRGIFDALAQLFHLFLTEEERTTRLLVSSFARTVWLLPDSKGPFHAAIELRTEAQQDCLVGDISLFDREYCLCFFCEKMEMKKLVMAETIAVYEHQALIDHILTASDSDFQKQQCVQFIKLLIAKLLNISQEQISSNESLYDIGFDSIVGIDLVHQIKKTLQVEIDIEKFFDQPSVDACAALILGRLQTEEGRSSSGHVWFKSSIEDRETFRLYCFPYGAGGASEYRAWEKSLSHFCHLVPIQLPGREERIEERPFDHIDRFLEAFETVFQDQESVPFAFYGHSIGALLAYAFTLHLQKKGKPLPTHLIVGAYSSPTIDPNPWFREISDRLAKEGISPLPTLERPLADAMIEKAIVAFTSGASREYVEGVDSLYLKKLLPSIWADLHLVKSFQLPSHPQLKVPIIALGGRTDDRVAIEEVKAWEALTSQFSFHLLDGDHFFLRKNSRQKEVLEIIESSVGQPV